MRKYPQTKSRELLYVEKIPTYQRRGISVNFVQRIYWMKCKGCGKKFALPHKRYTQGVGAYCEKSCPNYMKGKLNPHYITGSRLDRTWGSTRKRKFIKSIGKCQNCGFDRFIECLQVDHIIPFSQGGKTNIKNFMVLCANCHVYKTVHKNLPMIPK